MDRRAGVAISAADAADAHWTAPALRARRGPTPRPRWTSARCNPSCKVVDAVSLRRRRLAAPAAAIDEIGPQESADRLQGFRPSVVTEWGLASLAETTPTQQENWSE